MATYSMTDQVSAINYHPALLRRPDSLVHLFKAWRGIVPAGGTWAEEKIDGVRAHYRDGKLWTREGIEMHGVSHILAVLRRMEIEAGHPMFFDGEYLVGGTLRATLAHLGHKAGARDEGTLHLFDCLPLTEWETDSCSRPLVERKAMLVELIEASRHDAWEWPEGSRGQAESAAVVATADIWLEDADAVRAEAERIWARGGEGLVLKDASSLYRRTRTDAWQKVKQVGWSTRKAT